MTEERVDRSCSALLTVGRYGRTLAVRPHEQGPRRSEGAVAAPSARRRSERLEVRTTPEERALIDRAVSAAGTDLTDFVVANLTIAAQRVLADRTEFALDADARAAWEAVNRRRARDLPGLRSLMERPSPFVDE